jgi:hypothetical protein
MLEITIDKKEIKIFADKVKEAGYICFFDSGKEALLKLEIKEESRIVISFSAVLLKSGGLLLYPFSYVL